MREAANGIFLPLFTFLPFLCARPATGQVPQGTPQSGKLLNCHLLMMDSCRQTLLVRLELLEFSSEEVVFDARVSSVQEQEMRDIVRLNLLPMSTTRISAMCQDG